MNFTNFKRPYKSEMKRKSKRALHTLATTEFHYFLILELFRQKIQRNI